MKFTRPLFYTVTASAVALLCSLAHAEAPTTQQIQDDYDAKQYQNVIRDVAQAMPLAADTSKGYDKSLLLAQAGEAHLQLRQYSPAADSYNNAAKAASDPQTALIYRALSILIHKSSAGKYQPRQPTTQPLDANGKPASIDIIDMNSRTDAMNALLADETKVMSARLDSLKKQTSLNPLMDGIKQLGDLRAVEIAATGKDDASAQLISGVADHAGELMSTALSSMSTMVDKLQQQASQSTNAQVTAYNVGDVQTQRGLNSSEKSQLNQIVNNAKNISSACDDFAKAMSTPSSTLDGAKKQADALAKRADEVMNATYGVTNVTAPQTPGQPGQTPGHMPHHHMGQ
ncbi:MAG TPA: hypothetical protein VGF52_03335 [Tepidisphaeraceae bacterium]